MTEQEFITSMRVLFSVWRDTENADDILTDVVATIGSQCFDKHGLALRALEAECGSQMRAEYAPPPALRLEMQRDLDGAVRYGKVFGDFLDSMLSPKRS